MDEECKHGLPPEACSLCLHPYKPTEPDRVVFTMSAKFDGICRMCQEPIAVGDVIAHMMPSDTWVCLDCTP